MNFANVSLACVVAASPAFLVGGIHLYRLPASTRTAASPRTVNYSIADLGPCPEMEQLADLPLLSEDGAIAYSDAAAPARPRAVVWDRGRRIAMATPPGWGSGVRGLSRTMVWGWISKHGVGKKWINVEYKTVLWNRGTGDRLNILDGSWAVVSDGSLAVGIERGRTRRLHGVRRAGSELTSTVDLIGSAETPICSNDRGHVVVSGAAGVFLIERGVRRAIRGAVGYPLVYPMAIDDADQVVGACASSESFQHVRYEPSLWRDMRRIQLRTPREGGGAAVGINGRGDIVGVDLGTSPQPVMTRARALIWRQLKPSYLDERIPPRTGWELQVASSTNDRGEIVGIGFKAGRTRAFLLTPSEDVPYTTVTRS